MSKMPTQPFLSRTSNTESHWDFSVYPISSKKFKIFVLHGIIWYTIFLEWTVESKIQNLILEYKIQNKKS